MRRLHPALLVVATSAALATCGAQATPPAVGEHLLRRPPYLGVSCARANSIACDRVGLAVWLRRPATRVTATINGQPMTLPSGGPDGSHVGYLQPAGLLHAALDVTPARGRSFWAGSPAKIARVTIRIDRRDGSRDRASLSVPLRAGWG